MLRQGSISASLIAVGLLTALGSSAHAGGLSFSIAVPGLAVSANPAGAVIGVAQPGFYGQISVGDLPEPPQVIYAEPVIVDPDSGYVGPPIYLHVPPGYERHWAEHCREYHACRERVYFVRDGWYNRVYVPRHRYDRDDYDRDHYDRDHHDRGDYDRDHYRYSDQDRRRDFEAEREQHDRRDDAERDHDRGWHGDRGRRGARDNRRSDDRGRGHDDGGR